METTRNASDHHYHVSYRASFEDGKSLEKTIRTKKTYYAFIAKTQDAGGFIESVKACDGNVSAKCLARANGSIGKPPAFLWDATGKVIA